MNNLAMTTISSRLHTFKKAMPEWWPILFGMLVMFVPTFHDLFRGLWSTEEQIHGPIILGLSIWLMFRSWPRMLQNVVVRPSVLLGGLIFVLALLFYIITYYSFHCSFTACNSCTSLFHCYFISLSQNCSVFFYV